MRPTGNQCGNWLPLRLVTSGTLIQKYSYISVGTARAVGARMNPRTIASLALLVTASACGGRDMAPTPGGPTSSSPGASTRRPQGPDVHLDATTGPAYPGTGFRVHEWGTH